MHRKLTSDEEKEFREWTRDNYFPYSNISGMWHPVIQEECSKINKEQDEKVRLVLG